jgi:SHS family sialic acid transporter-like MFS transporter
MGPQWHRGISRGQWLALAAALLGWMFDGFEQGIVPLVARPALVELLHLQDEARRAAEASEPAARAEAFALVDREVGDWNGRITAAFLLGAALGGWLFGWLGDRLGRVRAMALSVLVYSGFTGLCGLAQDAPQLAAVRFLAALGMGGEWALGVALVMESWPGEARPVLAGLIGAAANVGFFLSGLGGLVLEQTGLRIDAGGWRWVLGVCAFPALLTFLLRLYVPESEKWVQAARGRPRPGLAAIFAPPVWRRTLLGALLAGLPLLCTWGGVQLIPLWVKQQTDDQQMVSFAQMGAALGAVFGAIAGALLGQSLGRRRAYFFLCVGSLAVTALLFRGSLLGPEVDWRFFAVVILVGALTASFYGWLPLYLPELFPTRIRATGQGFGYNAGRILAAAGALSTGYLMTSVFHGSYAQAGATITLIYLVAMAAIWLAPETRGRPLPE